MREKGLGGISKSIFDSRESCSGGVCPCWCVGGLLGALEEGIEWWDG